MGKTTCVRGLTLARLATVSVLEAGGKPSTWFPPEGLVELTRHAKSLRMKFNAFSFKKLEISKILKNLTFLKFYQKVSVAQTICLQTQINK